MKYNWAAVVQELRKVAVENITFPDRATKDYFHMMMFQTDTFHPFWTAGEEELSIALGRMPSGRCNYRSCDSYWLWKDGKRDMADALFQWFWDVEDIVAEHFADKWNFPDDEQMSFKINFPDWDALTNPRLVARVLKAARK